MAFVRFRRNHDQSVVKIFGRVLNEGSGGIVLVDEQSGQIFPATTTYGLITEAFVEPKAYEWIRLPYRSSGEQFFAKIIEMDHPFGKVSVPVGNGQHINIYGELSVSEFQPGYKVVVVRDHSGNIHKLDPEFIGTDLFSLLPKNPDAQDIFTTLTSKPLVVVDRRRKERRVLVQRLISDKKIYDNPIFYDYLSGDLSDTRRLINRWYPDSGSKMIEDVTQNLGEKFIILLVDPGVASRLEKFILFGRSALAANADLSAWKLRELFAADLGKTTIQKGIVLTRDQAKAIDVDGIDAEAFLNARTAAAVLDDTFNSLEKSVRAPHATNPQDEIYGRLKDYFDPGTSMFISVSKYELIAASIGYYDSGYAGDPTRKLYVIEADVPEISVIRETGLFERENRSGRDYIVSVGPDFHVSETQDREVEMFVPFKINPEDLRRPIKEYPTIPPQWVRTLKRAD
ncbi:MAG: hypothetical protein C5B49_02275 [Bdellovibrio sp.]|nr:MAG: hypothetical protein C5B49_02275 [Bdellovibrio sp.]